MVVIQAEGKAGGFQPPPETMTVFLGREPGSYTFSLKPEGVCSLGKKEPARGPRILARQQGAIFMSELRSRSVGRVGGWGTLHQVCGKQTHLPFLEQVPSPHEPWPGLVVWPCHHVQTAAPKQVRTWRGRQEDSLWQRVSLHLGSAPYPSNSNNNKNHNCHTEDVLF